MFPPGRARLAAKPSAIGSAETVMTIGMTVVACCAARFAGVPVATITSTFIRAKASARLGRRSAFPSAKRASTR